jgi:hypothetical protein
MEIIWVKGAEQGVTGDTEVEPVNKVNEELFPADPLEQCGVHGVESRGFILLPDSRP